MISTADIERTVEHRPWPLPRVPWVLFQSWQDLLFAHWRVAPETLRSLVPSQLELDLFEGDAWVGITPFRVSDLGPRGIVGFTGGATFPELNLRTYVRSGDRTGVYFFSLDAASRSAVAAARTAFRLPYRHARMQIGEVDGEVSFESQRDDGSATFAARYRPTDHAFEARPGSLEHFLVERYALFTVLRDGSVLRTEIHHRPWPLQPAEGEIRQNELAAAEGVPLPDEPPLLHFSRRQDTLTWLPM